MDNFRISKEDLKQVSELEASLEDALLKSLALIQEIGTDLQKGKSDKQINKKVDEFENFVNSIKV